MWTNVLFAMLCVCSAIAMDKNMMRSAHVVQVDLSSEGIVKMSKASLNSGHNAAPQATWKRCACEHMGHNSHLDCTEGNICQCRGEVRYGYNDTWSDPKQADGSIECSKKVFPTDPFFKQGKECQCKQGSSTNCTGDGYCSAAVRIKARCKHQDLCTDDWYPESPLIDGHSRCYNHGEKNQKACPGEEVCCIKKTTTPKCCQKYVKDGEDGNWTARRKARCKQTCDVKWMAYEEDGDLLQEEEDDEADDNEDGDGDENN